MKQNNFYMRLFIYDDMHLINSRVNIIMFHVNIIMFHANIVMLQVEI